MTSSTASEPFARIAVRVAGGAPAERVAAEAYAAGAVGLEERAGPGDVTLLLYAPASRAEPVRRAAAGIVGAGAVGPPEPVPDADWPEDWKRGLGACVISGRLVVRPSFVPFAAGPGQAELLIDPGQAFGTGAHESTWLALEWIDALAPRLTPGARVLDLGCGTGVLALAAVRLARARAVACDLDPVAAQAARANAAANGLAPVAVFVGSVEALREGSFDCIVANLLRRELAAVLEPATSRLRPGGHAVFSGLLARESQEVERALAGVGLRVLGTRDRSDASGECWRAWLTRR